MWDNNINIMYYSIVSETEAYPLCGFPQTCLLVQANEDGTAGDPIEEPECTFLIDQTFGTVTFSCLSHNRALNDTFMDVFMQCFNTTGDGVEYGHGLSN